MMLNAVMISSCAQHEEKPFYEDIQNFKKSDRENPPPQNAIVFVGSSSFTMWKDVQDYFPGYTIINRGFGGSTLEQAVDYADDIIIPYRPKQVVIYSGENDVAGGDVTADDVVHRFVTLFKKIRNKLPDVNIVYISMKPSPSRKKFIPVMADANEKIKDFLSKDKNATYVDVAKRMIDGSGNPREELFLDDMLHMKKEGYQIWKEELDPVLLK
ncbi:MAG: G-D-S-L family lipolytic protein [Chitinophagaceae bacterium]|nr:G-D-S-L family lipolytic protein [Chitinophagaceae bacterium]